MFVDAEHLRAFATGKHAFPALELFMEPALHRDGSDTVVAMKLLLRNTVAMIQEHLFPEPLGAATVWQDTWHPRSEIPAAAEALVFPQR